MMMMMMMIIIIIIIIPLLYLYRLEVAYTFPFLLSRQWPTFKSNLP